MSKRVDEATEQYAEGEERDCAKILIASALVGADEAKVTKETGLDRAYVDAIGVNLRRNKVWKGETVCGAGWLDPETGGIEFVADICVGLGYLQRVPASRGKRKANSAKAGWGDVYGAERPGKEPSHG